MTHYTETVLLMYYTNKGTPIVGATFPDPSFRALVETFDENNNGYLSQLEIDEITEIHVTNEDAYDWCNDAYSLVGIEYLTGLYILEWDLDIHDTGICPGNFMELDLQNNQDLSSVTVRGGCLRELYVKGLPILNWLDCAHNQLNDLDLSDLPRLTNLLMGSNWLTSINLSKLTALEYLDISANELTTVDLSKLTKLQYLYCADNKLSSLDVSKLARLTDLYCGGNPFTSLTLTNNTKLQWLTCTNSKLTSLNLSKNTALKSVDVSHSKDLTSLTPGINSNIEWLRLIGCDSLASINISRCTKLKKTVTNKKGITEDGVTYIQYATYDDYNEPVYSIVANLGLVLFYETPKAQEVKSGTDATFTCKAAGNGTVSYQWQYLIPGESSWKNVSAASGKKSSYTLTTAPRHDGYQYRCKVTNMYGKSVYSSKVTLRVLGILTPPSAISTLPGKTVKFTVKATGTDLVYQWQFKKPGETTWQNVAAESGKTASYSLKAEVRHDGYTYRCRVKNAAGTVWSKTAVLTIIVTPEITQQPKSISTTAGKTAAFTVKATGGALSYQWYYKKPGETTWQKVSASSGKTASYSLTVEARHNGYQYRCKITNAAGSVTSVTVTLTVK